MYICVIYTFRYFKHIKPYSTLISALVYVYLDVFIIYTTVRIHYSYIKRVILVCCISKEYVALIVCVPLYSMLFGCCSVGFRHCISITHTAYIRLNEVVIFSCSAIH